MTNLAACNGLYLALMITGGMVVPFDKMPTALQAVAKVLPAAPLADIMIGSLGAANEHVHGGILDRAGRVGRRHARARGTHLQLGLSAASQPCCDRSA